MQPFTSLLLLALIFLSGCDAPVDTPAPQEEERVVAEDPTVDVLAFTKTTGTLQESAPAATAFLNALGERDGIRIEITEDPAMFRDETLADFDVVLWFNTEGDVLNEAQQGAMERFIRSGNGFVGIHSAAATEYDWPWYGDLVGGYFTEHPNSPIEVEVTTERSDHPSTRSLPPRFVFSDEINHFDRDVRLDNQILLAIQGTGFTADDREAYARPGGGSHPVSWYKEFDGGRSWYTTLGDRSDTWMHPLFIRHLAAGIRWASGKNQWNRIRLSSQTRNPTALDIAPDGRVFWIERTGNLRIWDPKNGRVEVAGRLEVSRKGENGLLGLALAPDFATSRNLYLYYSAPDREEFEPGSKEALGENRLARFRMLDSGKLDLSSEEILLRVPSTRLVHEGGDLEFGPDGNLYVSLGDNANPFAEDRKFPPRDKRPGREAFDADRTAQNPFDLRGSILRLDPDGKSVPGNLYPSDGSLGRPEVFVKGTRNPFRMAIDPETGRLFWGDIGPDAFFDTPRGPRGFDEINFADGPGNFGWPRCIGFNRPYADYNYETEEIGPVFSCDDFEPALLAYDYTTVDYPALGRAFRAIDEDRTGRAAIAGVVYRTPGKAGEAALPVSLDGQLLMTEWTRNLLVSVEVGEDDKLGRVERLVPWEDFASPIDLGIAPDGALYVLEYGTQFGGDNSDAGLSRVEYSEQGLLTPIAHIEASATSSATVPLTVQFSGAASRAPNDEITSWEWDFDGDGTFDAKGPEVEHTYRRAGTFTPSLTVRSRNGKASFPASELILVGDTPPVVTIQEPPEGAIVHLGVPIRLAGSALDTEDGMVPCENLVWAIRLGHNSHSHPVAEIAGQCQAHFTPDVGSHGQDENIFYVVELNVREEDGESKTGLRSKATRLLSIAPEHANSRSGASPENSLP